MKRATLNGRTSVAQRLLAEVGDARQNIEELKIVIQQQIDILVKLSTELVSVKTELVTVKTELSNVKNRVAEEQKQVAEEQKQVAEEQKQVAEELKQVYARLDTISNSPALTIATNSTSPNPSYANVVRPTE